MADENEQLKLEFPSTDEFPSFDDVPDDEAQAQIPDESFDETTASDSESGCCFA